MTTAPGTALPGTVLPGTVLPGDAGAEMTTRALLSEGQETAPPKPLTAVERLTQSRNRMREAMMPDVRRRIEASRHDPAAPWLSRLRKVPGVAIVVDALSSWWSSHPLRPASMVGGEVSRAMVRPLAQEHPIGLVFAGLAIGAIFTLTKPWRWLLKPALFAGLVPQLASKLVSNLPLDSWMGMLNLILSTSPSPPPAATQDDTAARATVDRPGAI